MWLKIQPRKNKMRYEELMLAMPERETLKIGEFTCKEIPESLCSGLRDEAKKTHRSCLFIKKDGKIYFSTINKGFIIDDENDWHLCGKCKKACPKLFIDNCIEKSEHAKIVFQTINVKREQTLVGKCEHYAPIKRNTECLSPKEFGEKIELMFYLRGKLYGSKNYGYNK